MILSQVRTPERNQIDRKSTRLNSSHSQISYAVFCLKKKKLTDYVFLDLLPIKIEICQHFRSVEVQIYNASYTLLIIAPRHPYSPRKTTRTPTTHPH